MKDYRRWLPLVVLFGGCPAQDALKKQATGEVRASASATATANSNARPAIDFGGIAKRVSLAFREEGAGFRAQQGAAQMDVASDGELTLQPVRVEGAGHAQKVTRGAPFGLRTISTTRESVLDKSAAKSRLDGAGGVRIERGAVVEQLTPNSDGLEQAWSLAARPAGSGDFVVRLGVSGHDFAGESAHGLHFADKASGLGFRYGIASWVDASGHRTEVTPSRQGAQIVLRVPASVVEAASYPVVLDPLISAEFAIDNPVGSPADAEDNPAVTFGGGQFFVVWAEARPPGGATGIDIYGTRVTTTGTVVDPAGIQISNLAGDEADPAVTFDGLNAFLVVYTASDGLHGNRVNIGGTPGADFVVATASSAARVATNSIGTSLVAFQNLNAGTAQQEIWITSLLRGGSTPLAPVKVASYGTAGEITPDVASDGTNFLVVWQDNHLAPAGQLYGQLFNAALVNQSAFIPIVASAEPASAPSVDFGGGTYLFTYQNTNFATTARIEVRAATISTSGTVGTDTLVNAGAGANEYSLSPKPVWNGIDFGVLYVFLPVGGATTGEIHSKHVKTDATLGVDDLLATGASIATRQLWGASDANGTILATYARADAALGGNDRIKGVIEGFLPLGAACTAAGNCVSGFCVDGVCCNTACNGGCQSCSSTDGASSNFGTCVTSPIGYAGNPGCGAYVCGGSPTCPASCATDGNCAATFFCQLGTCHPKVSNNVACTASDQCLSSFCVDGVCCNSLCTAQCAACNVAGHGGTCSPQTGAPVGARPACTGVAPCGGACDGVMTAACAYPTVSCRNAGCAGGVATASANCDGAGACPAVSTTPCNPYLCGASACLLSCAGDGDCIPTDYCSAGTCMNKNGPGVACSAADQCSSTFCSPDLHCCNNACANPPHGVSACTLGVCNALASCSAGFFNCDGLAGNGCETPESASNCGACTIACSANHITTPTCSGGMCNGMCSPGFDDCNGNKLTDGCETALNTVANCGHCGTNCNDGNPCTTDSCVVNAGVAACRNVSVAACGSGCGPIAGCTVTDSDGDGLNDIWETNSVAPGVDPMYPTGIAGYIDLNCNGQYDVGTDTPLPNADVHRPNVYVKWDAMYVAGSNAACAVKADCPSSQLCRKVGAIFKCVAHDGVSPGSGAHCKTDLDCPGDECGNINGSNQCVAHNHMPSSTDTTGLFSLQGNPVTLPAPMTQVQQAYTQHNAILTYYPTHDSIPETTVTSLYAPGTVPACAGTEGVDAVSLYTVKAAHFPANLRPAYHYGLFAHWNSCQPGSCSSCPGDPKANGSQPLDAATGLAEIVGNDFIVSLGTQALARRGDVTFAFPVAVSFMHELGHNLGLLHGGADSYNRKPNYISIMNYSYSSAIPYGTSPGLPTVCDNSTIDWYRVDYSSFLAGSLNLGIPTPSGTSVICGNDPSMSAPGLNETVGITGRAPADPNANDLSVFAAGANACQAATNGTDVDWNDDSTPETKVYSDLGMDWVGDNGHSCTIAGYSDWSQSATTVGTTTTYHLNNLVTSASCNTGFWADGAPGPHSITYEEPTLPELTADHKLFPFLSVQVQVRPGCSAHWIAPASSALVPIVAYGSQAFDVSLVDQTSLRFGGAAPVSVILGDVNGDGTPDLTANFSMSSLQLAPTVTKSSLSGIMQTSQSFGGIGTFELVSGPSPLGVTVKDVNIYEDDPATHAAEDAFKKSCGDPPVHILQIADCLAAPIVDACTGMVEPNAANNGHIDRIELGGYIRAGDSGDPHHVADVLKQLRDKLDSSGCPKLAAVGSTAYLPVKDLDNAETNASFYNVYFTVMDNSGNPTSAVCKVNVFHDVHGEADQASRAQQDPKQARVSLGCAVCVGNSCGACPNPGATVPDNGGSDVVCGNSLQDCAHKQSDCASHPGQNQCNDYLRQCTNTCVPQN